ncbi:MAG: hypothetical protein JXB30_05740 [Anaerolineae bacterium]|nr:hypothetical protein [Anaerolineae bacterium]
MLTDRIMGALTFRSSVYEEVESDTSFTQTAWVLVVVISLVNQIGAQANAGSVLKWVLGVVIGTIFSVLAFAIAAYVIAWFGKTVYHAEVSFDELVRTLGLAYIWNAIGVIGVVALVLPTLVCALSPLLLVAWLLSLVAALIAAKSALDLEWVPTIISVVVGWVIMFLVMLIPSWILGLFLAA